VAPQLRGVSDPHPGVSQHLSPKDFVFLFIGGSLIRGKPFFLLQKIKRTGTRAKTENPPWVGVVPKRLILTGFASYLLPKV
jgi:hypothetical protein